MAGGGGGRIKGGDNFVGSETVWKAVKALGVRPAERSVGRAQGPEGTAQPAP